MTSDARTVRPGHMVTYRETAKPVLVRRGESSDSQCTPSDLALELGVWGIDPCSNPHSDIQSIRRCMLEDGQDGLADPWTLTPGGPLASAFANWPYSAPLPWCERLANHDAPWCGLGKLDPTTKWFLTVATCKSTWAPFKKRLKYKRNGNVGSAEFPSFLVWRDWEPPPAVLARLWTPRSES